MGLQSHLRVGTLELNLGEYFICIRILQVGQKRDCLYTGTRTLLM